MKNAHTENHYRECEPRKDFPCEVHTLDLMVRQTPQQKKVC